MISEKRATHLNNKQENPAGKYVLYWMQMTHRTAYNYALSYAIERANTLGLPLIVYQGLNDDYPHANDRLHTFILQGAKELFNTFNQLGINYGFYLVNGKKKPALRTLISSAASVISDDYPTFLAPKFNKKVAQECPVRYTIIDSCTAVPMNSFTKEEWAAYTIRPKIHALLPTHLTPHTLPTLKNKKKITLPNYFLSPDFSVKKEVRKLNIDHLVCPTTLIGGESEAKKQLLAFISRIDSYDTDRNDPTKDGTSKLSAYLHFGMISPIDIILSICRAKKIHPAEITDHKSVSAYVEELVVRRDLAYNYCKFNPQHTTFEGLNDWSKITLNKHRKDKREYTYTLREFEEAKTHDPAWNAAQHKMVATGRMHGYMRMYWCKKILEWTKTPEDAFRIAVFLNDKYQLDGRDPNGYTGIAWSIGGKHDRPWFERAIFGQVRYMNFAGLKKKFNINAYISKNTTK